MNDRITELAKKANEYADIEYGKRWKSGLLVKEHWQSIRDKRFYELARNEVLEEAAKVCDRMSNDPKASVAQELALDLASDAIRGLKS